jgi:hypothetical protein
VIKYAGWCLKVLDKFRAHLEENLGAATIEMTDDDMRDIETGFAKIDVQGARSSEQQLAGIDRGAKLGTRSISA